jgi:hypothetical protein
MQRLHIKMFNVSIVFSLFCSGPGVLNKLSFMGLHKLPDGIHSTSIRMCYYHHAYSNLDLVSHPNSILRQDPHNLYKRMLSFITVDTCIGNVANELSVLFLACADLGARTPIGRSGNFKSIFFQFCFY